MIRRGMRMVRFLLFSYLELASISIRMKHQKLEGAKFKTYNFLKTLGAGAWAVVYEAIDERDESQVAIKVIPKKLMQDTPKLEELVQTEMRVLKQCKNENVIHFVDNFTSENSVFIVMEYCNGGDLEGYLDKKRRLTEDEATTFLKQIINGFKGLHEVNAMHRDFKVANVLLSHGICKIADLGFAKQMTKNVTKTILGTSLTMAPEVLDEKPYGFEADIWSLGVVYYQLLYGKYPYQGVSDFDILKKIKSMRPDYSGVNLSDKARDFIDRCLTVNPKARISWKEIYDHPLIKEAGKIIYGLTSKLRVNDNRNFYEREVKIDENLIYAEKNAYKKKQVQPLEVVKEQKPVVDFEKLMKQNEEKKKIALALERYEKLYLNRRNNIMFIFKYVTPYIYSLYDINANHGITLFIISKKAYHDMKRFNADIRARTNALKLAPYFAEFANSPKYREIEEITGTDLEIILAQIVTYKEDIQFCSSDVKREFDIERVYSSNWENFVRETITGYEFQLGEAVDRLKGQQKRDLIKVIEALLYFKEHSENADIEEFDKRIEGIDFGKAESKIQERLASLLKWE